MLPYFNHPLIVAVHAVDALTGLCEDEFVDPVLTHFALEAVSMVRVVAGHDGFIEDGKTADVATVGAVGAYWRAIREEEQVGVCGDFFATFRALETVDMEE